MFVHNNSVIISFFSLSLSLTHSLTLSHSLSLTLSLSFSVRLSVCVSVSVGVSLSVSLWVSLCLALLFSLSLSRPLFHLEVLFLWHSLIKVLSEAVELIGTCEDASVAVVVVKRIATVFGYLLWSNSAAEEEELKVVFQAGVNARTIQVRTRVRSTVG